MVQKSDDTYYYRETAFDKSLIFNNKLVYPSLNNLIYTYDYITNEFNSLQYPGDYTWTRPYALFKFENKLISVSNAYENKIYFTDFGDNNVIKWDSLEVSDLFDDWDQYSVYTKDFDKDIIFDAKMLSNSSGYLIIGKNKPGGFSSTDKWIPNLVKISSNNPTEVKIDNNKIENQDRAFLWNSLPYPIPSRSLIQSKIFWNSIYPLSDINLEVYNIYGAELSNPNITIEASNSYSGLLQWDCSGVASGVYLIQVSLRGESISFPVIISK